MRVLQGKPCPPCGKELTFGQRGGGSVHQEVGRWRRLCHSLSLIPLDLQHAGGLVGGFEDVEMMPEWSGAQCKLQKHRAVQGWAC